MSAESSGQTETVHILRKFKPVQAFHIFLSSVHYGFTHSSRSTKVKCPTNVTPEDEPVGKTEKERKLPLHDCIRRGDLDKLTKLVEDGWPVDLKDDDGWTPLCIVSWLGHKEAVKLLISHGADVNVKDFYGWTPLHYLAYHGNKEMASVLISHAADVNAKDNDGETPLCKSTCEGHKEIVELLISNGADVNVKDKLYGIALLHNSELQDDPAIFKVLINHGADVNIQDNFRRTPLHTNAKSGNIEIVKLLIQHKADVNIKSVGGDTPLHISTGLGNNEIVKLLIKHGADIDAVDIWGKTPLMNAKQRGHSDIVDIIKQTKYPGRKIKKVVTGFFGYSSREREITVESTDDKGQITALKYESLEVSKQVVTKRFETESVTEGKEGTVKEDKGSQSHKVEELVKKSAETSSYTTTPKVDVCSWPGLSSAPASLAQLSTPPLKSTAFSPPPPSSSSLSSSSSPPPSSSSSSSSTTSSSPHVQPSVKGKISWHVQEILKAVNGGKSDEDHDSLTVLSDHLGGNVIVIQQRTENHYHYPRCHCNNKQNTGEEVKEDKSESLNVCVGGIKYCLLRPPQGAVHEKGDEDEYAYKTREDINTGGEGRDEQPVDIDMSATKSSASKTSNTSATKIRRRLESQAGNIEKMFQSCMACDGVCQDQSCDRSPLHHGCTHVPAVNVYFINQPNNVEVRNTKQVKCEKCEVGTAEMMPVNCTCNFKSAAQKSPDDENDEENTDDNNSEDSTEIQAEDGNGSDYS